MSVSTFPPARRSVAPTPSIFPRFTGPIDRTGIEFGARLAHFSVARAVVFTAVVALVLVILAKTSGELRVSYSSRLVLGALAAAYISSVVQWWAGRRRRAMYMTALTLIVVDQLLFSLIAYVTGGVASGATSLLGVACLVGGLLLGVSGAIVAGVAGAIFFSLLILVTQGGDALLPPDQPRQLYRLAEGQAVYYYVFNLLMLLLVGLMASYLAERLERAGGEVKQAERRADHAERMAALGRLAAGLAHEIRNPLGSISGSVQLLRSCAERDEDRELCDIVLREAARLNELVTDMVDLSKPRPPVKARVDVGHILRDIVELAKSSGRGAGDVELVRSGPDTAWIDADSGMMRQLVWNLVRNALQATGSGGQVRVRLEVDRTARLSVEDDGVGIDSEAMERLFDAFFTTRSKGTGLGLAVVKRIADEHDFTITVSSDPGDGTRFTVDFGPARQAPTVA